MKCHYCEQEHSDKLDLRPYGPGGAYVCFPCAMKPHNRQTTDAVFSKHLDEQSKNADYLVFGGGDGPIGMKRGTTLQ